MSTGEKHMELLVASKTYHAINRSVKTLDVSEIEMERSVAADTPGIRIQKLAKVYTAIKPLLAAIGTLPLLPQTWRAAVMIFVATVDAVVNSDLNPDFKAGKDL